MEPEYAALRIAMLFDRALPEARAKFLGDPALHIMKLSKNELCRLIEEERVTLRKISALAKALDGFSLLIANADEYVLVVGWQDPDMVSVQSLASHITAVIAETADWNEERWETEWEKDYP
jgi:hypothetical protein